MEVMYSGGEKKLFFDVFRRAGVVSFLFSYLDLATTGIAEKIVITRKQTFPWSKLYIHSGLLDANEEEYAAALESHGGTLESIRDGYDSFLASVSPFIEGAFDFDSHVGRQTHGRFLWSSASSSCRNVIPTWSSEHQTIDDLAWYAQNHATVAVAGADDLSVASKTLRNYLVRPHIRKLSMPEAMKKVSNVCASIDLSSWSLPLKNRETYFTNAGQLTRLSLDNPPEKLIEFARRHGISEAMLFSTSDAMAEVRGKTVVTRWQDLYFACLYNVVLAEPHNPENQAQIPFWQRRLPKYDTPEKINVARAREHFRLMRFPVPDDKVKEVAWWMSLLHHGQEDAFLRVRDEIRASYVAVMGSDAPSLNEPFDVIRVNACHRSVPSVEVAKARQDLSNPVVAARPRSDLPRFEHSAELPTFRNPKGD